MRGMEIKAAKRGMGPMDDDSMMEEVIREVAGRIDGFDTDNIMSSYRAKNAPPEDAGAQDGEAPPVPKEECPECAKGECMEPEHMDEDTLRAMLAEKGGGAE